ncbi:MAG: hypothetical protein ACYTXI_36585 [Nostoc sp.]
MKKRINNWMKWWRRSRSISFGESLKRFVTCGDRPHPNPPLTKGREPAAIYSLPSL